MAIEYTIAFSFTTKSDTDTLVAQLRITDSNVISLASGRPVQVQSAWGATPPLATLSVTQNSLAVQAEKTTTGNPQSVKIVVPITATGSTLSGNFPFSGVEVGLQYQFIGYEQSGSISVGNFQLPFPS
jgi:hypothetical protein